MYDPSKVLPHDHFAPDLTREGRPHRKSKPTEKGRVWKAEQEVREFNRALTAWRSHHRFIEESLSAGRPEAARDELKALETALSNIQIAYFELSDL